MAESEAYGLSDSEIEDIKSISLSEDKSEELLNFDYNYKAAALAGLAITQGQAGRQLLERVAARSELASQECSDRRSQGAALISARAFLVLTFFPQAFFATFFLVQALGESTTTAAAVFQIRIFAGHRYRGNRDKVFRLSSQ